MLGVGPFCVEFDDGEIVTTRREDRQRLIASAPTLQAEVDRLRAAAKNVVDCWGVGNLNITAMNRFVDELRALIAKQE